MREYPTNYADLDEWLSRRVSPGIYALKTSIGHELDAHANIAIRPSADHIIVFLPGAQDAKSQRRVPFFHRWTWQEELPEFHVIALGDPAISLDEKLRGGWFLHAEHDLAVELASMVQQIADALDVPHTNITFHGSSIGGYGSLAMAAHLRGAYALSEIPQIDVELWPFMGSQVILEKHLGEPLSSFREKFPERVNVFDRLKYAEFVPPFTLVTNPTDYSFDLHHQFMADVQSLETERHGEQRLAVTSLAAGHKPLPKPAVIAYLQSGVLTRLLE